MKPNRILVPLDGSEIGEAAIAPAVADWAKALPRGKTTVAMSNAPNCASRVDMTPPP